MRKWVIIALIAVAAYVVWNKFQLRARLGI